MARNPILVALDFDNLPDAVRLVEQVRDHVGGFKVGMELCNSAGTPQVIDAISAAGGQLFVDLKFKDIPNTVAGAARAVSRPGVLMFNVHCDGGAVMLRAAVTAAQGSAHQPLVIGVTVLTSVDQVTLNDDLRIPGPMTTQVEHLARLGQVAGLNGVVCSAHEVAAIKAACGSDFLTIVPGVRPTWAGNDDQQRIMTPMESMRVGADYLVIGRPITRPPSSIGSPATAARRILEELNIGREHEEHEK